MHPFRDACCDWHALVVDIYYKDTYRHSKDPIARWVSSRAFHSGVAPLRGNQAVGRTAVRNLYFQRRVKQAEEEFPHSIHYSKKLRHAYDLLRAELASLRQMEEVFGRRINLDDGTH